MCTPARASNPEQAYTCSLTAPMVILLFPSAFSAHQGLEGTAVTPILEDVETEVSLKGELQPYACSPGQSYGYRARVEGFLRIPQQLP